MTLQDAFDSLEDPRIEKNKRHTLKDILFIAICGFICSAGKWTEIEEFGQAKQE